MEIVVGLNLTSIKPKVWDESSDYHLPNVNAVMVSYAQFHESPTRRDRAIKGGLHTSLGIPEDVKIYLDNGAFRFSRAGGEVPRDAYKEFVKETQPDWYAIPQDYIPTPCMSDEEQLMCLQQTMAVNKKFAYDGFVPILHVCRLLDTYFVQFEENEKLAQKKSLAIGGIVPNLLRAPKAMSGQKILDKVYQVKETFEDKKLHLFGVGGTSTLHVAALLGMDSVDSVGWRTRAARGLIQLPGIGDRSIADLGNWKVREPNTEELKLLEDCQCPACQEQGIGGLKIDRTIGFCNRATHNLWTLLEENRMIQEHLKAGTYAEWYKDHLHNTIYRPLIEQLVEKHLNPNDSVG